MTFNERQKFPPINLSNELSKVPVDVEKVVVTIGSLGRGQAKRLFCVINYSAMKSKWQNLCSKNWSVLLDSQS